MTLSRQHLLFSAALALPAAVLLLFAINLLQARERIASLERVARAHVVDVFRDACEQDPMWFLAGPRVPRPRLDERQMPDADVLLPRPSSEELPFEMFALDDQQNPSSVAGPRLADDLRRALRNAKPWTVVSSEYAGRSGRGIQTAIVTGWGGLCSALLFRQQPVPGRTAVQAGLFAGLYLVCALVALAVAAPAALRMRKLSQAARRSAKSDYTEIVEVPGRDEIGSMAAQFNETAADIRRRVVDARDREELLRRYVDHTSLEVGEPLAALELQLGRMLAEKPDRDLVAALKETHRLSMAVRNQAAVIRLRRISEETPRESVNLATAVAHVAESRRSLAKAAGVTIDTSRATDPVSIPADEPLIVQAIANVVDNAILYNRAGGSVRVELHAYDHGERFKLIVADTGPGVSDEEFAGLTANKRFRGDESRTRRPGGRGLGLAMAREVADRFGLQFDLRRPTSGGLEAEFATR
jgi:signal transduction histidine kinase